MFYGVFDGTMVILDDFGVISEYVQNTCKIRVLYVPQIHAYKGRGFPYKGRVFPYKYPYKIRIFGVSGDIHFWSI